jgi:hypothetical protein
MQKKGSLFIINNTGSYLQTQRGVLRALDDYASVIQVLAPFDINTVVEVNYLIYGVNNSTLTQYVSSTVYTGADVLESTHSLYQTVSDWVLWEIPVTSRALAKISKYKSSQLGIAFSFKERYAPPTALTYIDTFGISSDLPASGTTLGDYYLCDTYNYTSAEASLEFTKHDYAVWNGTIWTKPTQYTLTENTTTINLVVSGSMSAIIPTELTSDEEFVIEFTDVQSDVNNMINGSQVVGEATKATYDGDDNEITTTYETITDNNAKLALKVDKTTTVIGLDLQNNIELEEFKTAIGNATLLLDGLMSKEDKASVEALLALLDVEDPDSLVNNINELVAIFVGYPEGELMVDSLAAKADQATTYTKIEVDNLISTVYRVKGSVNAYANLPTSDQTIGDVWNVKVDESTDDSIGVNYAWVGIDATHLDGWDNIGGIEALATAVNDGLMSQEDYSAMVLLKARVDQDVTENSTPQFTGITLYNALGNAIATYDGIDVIFSYGGKTVEMAKNLFTRVKATVQIEEGDVVQYSGSVGVSGKINGKPAVQSEINIAPYLILGVATEQITVGSEGEINFYGAINGIDTTGYNGTGSEDDILYFDSAGSTPGALTFDEPTAPNVQIKIALLSIEHGTTGQIKVRPNVGHFLGDAHDVYFNGHTFVGGESIKYNITNERFEIFNTLPLEQIIPMTYDTTGKFYCDIDSLDLVTNTKFELLIPEMSTDLTETVTISLDNEVTYKALKYADTLNEVLVKHIQDTKIDVYYDGTELMIKGEPLIGKQITFDESIVSIYDTFKAIKGSAQLDTMHGLSLNQQNLLGDVVSSLSYTNYISQDANGDLVVNNAYTSGNLTFNIISGNTYFIRIKMKDTSVNVLRNEIIIFYSDATIQLLTSILSDDELVIYGKITANKSLLANIGARANAGGGQLDNLSWELIDITNTPLASKSASEMNLIVQDYFEGNKDIEDFELSSIGVQLFDVETYNNFDDYTVATYYRLAFDNLVVGKDYYISTNELTTLPTGIYMVVGDDFHSAGTNAKNIITNSVGQNLTFTATADHKYIKVYGGSSAIIEEFIKNMSSYIEIQIEEGTTATTYTAYNSPPNFKAIATARSVGTDIRDTVYPLNGAWWYKQYVKITLFVDTDFTTYNDTSYTNLDRISITKPLDYFGYGIGDTSTGNVELESGVYNEGNFADDTASIGKLFTNNSTTLIYYCVAKGTYADLTAVQTALTGTTIKYELAEQVITEIETQGSIIQESNTTLQQVNNFATEYDITFAGNIDKLVSMHDDRIVQIKQEMEQLRWTDLVRAMTPQYVNPSTSKPDYDYVNIGLLFPKNDTTEQAIISYQMPHSYAVGTNIRPHLHVGQAYDLQAVFKFEYKWVSIGGDGAVANQTITFDEYAVEYSGGLMHQILRSSTEIDGTGKGISSILKGFLYRDDDVYTGDMLVTDFDIHYREDSNGSKEEFIK